MVHFYTVVFKTTALSHSAMLPLKIFYYIQSQPVVQLILSFFANLLLQQDKPVRHTSLLIYTTDDELTTITQSTIRWNITLDLLTHITVIPFEGC